jgi:N-acetylneuraminic acid mutarotase
LKRAGDNILTGVLLQVDIFSYGVMMIHALSGQWPFPGEAVRVNPRNPNNPNDLVGVTEFDRREEYINLIGNEHPLMTLIQGCLSNSPSHRPTSSEVHQRVSAVAADHPPSFTNIVEMMDRIKTLSQENERVLAEKDTAVAEKNREIAEIRTEKDVARENEKILSELKEAQSTIGSLRESHSIEVEALQIENTDIRADIEHLHAIIAAKEREYKSDKQRHEYDRKEIKQRYEKQLEMMKKEKQELEHQHAFQLRAVEDEYRTVKNSMEQQHQAQLESKVSELSAKDALILRKSGTIQSLQVKLGQALGTASSKGNLSIFSPGVKLTFTERANVPETIDSLDQGITVGQDMYVGVTYDNKVFKYSITEDSWGTLPLAPVSYARIGCLNKKVLVLGGRLSFNQVTADIHEFDEASQQWVKSTSIPPMPTARSSATVISWSSPPALIVCGGRNQRNQPMTVVEVYYGRNSQWHTVTGLPFPRANVTHTIIHNVLYLVGGYEGKGMTSYKKTVLSILIPQLLESSLQSSPKLWQNLSISNIPNFISAAASLGGCLLAVGGVKDPNWPPKPNSVVSSVHAYCPSTSSWILVGELPQPLYHCITATLPTGELLVMGGMTPSVAATNTTFKYSLSVSL